eukprot:1006919-Pleurochrysis_carterae.AAC.1
MLNKHVSKPFKIYKIRPLQEQARQVHTSAEHLRPSKRVYVGTGRNLRRAQRIMGSNSARTTHLENERISTVDG